MKRTYKEAQGRGRLALTVTALVPGTLGSISLLAGAAGRLAWLGPVLALPVGLILCRAWGSVGEKGLALGLEETFGKGAGRCLEALYLIWGLVLMVERADGYARRLMTTTQGENVRWLYLGVGLALCLWLSRGKGEILARAGRIFFLAVVAALGAALLLALPGADWKNLWPPQTGDLVGLPWAATIALSLSGYGVYALCPPKGEGETARTGAWTVWSCGVLSALALAVVGAFGPVLAGGIEEPFLLLLQGVEIPGAFRRGEAVLTAVLALADWSLLALLIWGWGSLWQSLTGWNRGRGIGAAGAFLIARLLPRWPGAEHGMRAAVIWGNLVLGVGVPLLTWLCRGRKGSNI